MKGDVKGVPISLLVRGDRIVVPEGVMAGWIAVQDGRIADIGRGPAPPAAHRAVDAGNAIVLPGLIDSHVHIRFPGHPERETWESGSDAAASAGVTTLVEMPISVPAVASGAILRARIEAVAGRSRIDYAFYGGGGIEARDEYEAMAREGAVAFKIFMHRPQAGREHEFLGLHTTQAGDLLTSLRRLAPLGIPVCFHAEEDAILEAERQRVGAEHLRGPNAHAAAHPPVAEEVAIAQVALLARETGAPVSICHISSSRALAVAIAAKRAGVNIHLETCPHYLAYTHDDFESVGADAKINPPLRHDADRAALWQALASGDIDFVGSDHAPFTVEEKARGKEDIHKAPSGAPGIEMTLPILAAGVREGRITWSDVARLAATGAASFFGLAGKGALTVGNDADFVIVDEVPHTVRADELRTMSRGTAGLFAGFASPVTVRQTFLRGEPIYADGRFVGDRRGRVLLGPRASGDRPGGPDEGGDRP